MADDGFDELAYYESQYADDLDALDELEAIVQSEKASNVEIPEPEINNITEVDADCTDANNKRRKLFSPAKDDFDSDLVIDEECIPLSPKRKRPRLEQRKPSMPTTLDIDRDLEIERQKELRDKNCLSTPQMIEKILRHRENKHSVPEFIPTETTAQKTFQLTKVLVCPPVHSDFVSATSSDGQRVYMRMRSHEKLTSVLNSNELITGSRSLQLLPQTLPELRQSIYEKKQQERLLETQRITEEVRRETLGLSDNTLMNQVLSESTMTMDSENLEDEGIYSGEENSNDGLWVNKFAPTHYTHLLSDEGVNRSLLKWLKLWDHVVFGRPIQPKKSQGKENQPKQPQEKFKKKFGKFKTDEQEEELDEFNRPHFKISLLCGAPGLGKTTLAHIIARHAGYHVVEMNASDDRSAETFKKKLEETTQMKSVLGTDQRPNCLIIDEIDGAPQAAINVLLNAIAQTKKQEPKKKKKKETRNFLQRPIICICNDLYVPSLRQLRQQSYLLQFPQTTTARLASRLRQLCRHQSLECDLSSLLALCEKSGNDIRACINTLQFVRSKGTTKLNVEIVKDLSIGQKDQHKSIFYTWNEIFQLPKNKRKMDRDSQAVQQGVMDGQKVSQFSARFYHILDVVMANGEYEKTLQGVHENFLMMKFKDIGMTSVNKAYEWMLLYDHINKEVALHQEWVLMRYTPYIFVLFHLLFSCISPPKIQFPQTANENRQKQQKSENLLTCLYQEMLPNSRCYTPPTVAIQDLVPHLLAIMTPSLRPVNMQLYSSNEKKQLADLVHSMLAYNLTYRQEKDAEGQYKYVLEPNMAEVCAFHHPSGGARRQLSYALKQIISKEVESERMRRSESMMTGKVEQKGSKVETVVTTQSSKQKVPSHLQRLETSINQISLPAEKPVVDFFSRFTKIKRFDVDGNEQEKPRHAKIRDPGIGNSDLWFKYNEGFSNAIRRTVYVKDLM
uniref:Chromosome transmission fidelity protein 18 homolog n=1 Tax=Phallusia mammillata TaxID=59560 RepID=A0A6F9D8N0_9ASCI|nr:chromosome transmission fidelity protein 18 homolog [Phallusia mammillata]